MKVYLEPPRVQSRSIGRIAEALERFAPPSVEVVRYASQADLVVFHVIGRYDQVTQAAREIKARGGRYAVGQYVLRSTQRPDSRDWLELWENADLVWSYYDLHDLLIQDGMKHVDFHFYMSPLGVDTSVFGRHWWKQRQHLILTSGFSRLTESVRECVNAARKHHRTVVHLGPELNYGPDVTCYRGLKDEELVNLYNSCAYVSGLRRTEGFELPAAEGLLCGARPIMFDRPHYRQWYGDSAIYIRELDRDAVEQQLIKVLSQEPEEVSDEEWEQAAALFNWPRIVGDFWRQLQ